MPVIKQVQILEPTLEEYITADIGADAQNIDFNDIKLDKLIPESTNINNPLINQDTINESFKNFGLIENLNKYPNAINVKNEYVTSETTDAQAFMAAIDHAIANLSYQVVIPHGTYNFDHTLMNLPKEITFIGESANTCIIKNAYIVASHGIILKNLTFDGGTTRTEFEADPKYNSMPWRLRNREEVIIDCSPNMDEKIDVQYENCVFKNVGCASISFCNTHWNKWEQDGYTIRQNIIKNCSFENIIVAAVYHVTTIDQGIYINNTFTNIGYDDSTISDGAVLGLCLGDITNNTRRDIKECIIIKNTFKNFKTKNDINNQDIDSKANHNMIGVRGLHAIISYNTCDSLAGYGTDKEAIYTKCVGLECSHNLVKNGGFGEGYLCFKNYTYIEDGEERWRFEKVHNIHDNIIIGEYGTAMRCYTQGNIFNNYININNARDGIKCVSGSSKTINVHDNYVRLGIAEFPENPNYRKSYNSETQTWSDYSSWSGIYENKFGDINISNNTIVINDTLTNGDSGDFKRNLRSLIDCSSDSSTNMTYMKINNNQLYVDNWNKGINFSTSSLATDTKNVYVEINNNCIDIKTDSNDTTNPNIPIYINFGNTRALKNITLKHNVAKLSRRNHIQFFAQIYGGNASNVAYSGILEFVPSQIYETSPWMSNGNYVKTNFDYISTLIPDYITGGNPS